MRPNFKLPKLALPGRSANGAKDPFARWKQVLMLLALANVAVFFILVRPIGGTTEDLSEQLEQSRRQVRIRQTEVVRTRALVAQMEKLRAEQNGFVNNYFMDRRTASSTILTEIGAAASKAGLKPKEHSFVIDPVEGSDSLSMMTITANYEGSYGNLVDFVNQVDRSKRFLIIDNIQAAPQQQAGSLAARFRINTFVREAAN
ncbi:MAG: type 4a pilus biogenesis protein PilO [Bryobacterales bacterium]|nr:type 4a pilus biogenesis protein PilO [Bryobacterales bacterium]